MDRGENAIPGIIRPETEPKVTSSLSSDPSSSSSALDLASSVVKPETQPHLNSSEPKQYGFRSWKRWGGISLAAIAVIAGFIFISKNVQNDKKSSALNASLTGNVLNVKQQTIGLQGLNQQLSSNTNEINTLTVNGKVNVSNAIVLQPSGQPGNATAGEMYFNKASNQMVYFDGSGYVTLSGGGNITNNTTNVTNVTNSGSSDGVSATGGTSGDLAMFTGSNKLGDSLITEGGSSINVGGSTDDVDGDNINIGTTGATENVSVGSTSGTSTTSLQGGTGGFSILTGPTSGTSGPVIISSGASSTTAAGNVSVDTGSSVVNGTVIADKTFESGIEYMCGNYGATLTQSSAEAHSGSYSLAVTAPTAYNQWEAADCEPFNTQVIAGHSYLLSAWVRAGSDSSTVNFDVYFSCNIYQCDTGYQTWASTTDNSSGWTHVTGLVVAPPNTNYMQIQVFGNNSVDNEATYLDDMTDTDLTSSSAVSELNLGTSNAQEVTLGNNAEIGSTDIYGGGSGINLNSGVGSVNVTAADFAIQDTGGFTSLFVDTNTGDVDIDTSPSNLTTPTKLAITGSTSDNTTNALLIQNSSNTSLATIGDDGQVDLGVGGGNSFGRTTTTNNYWGGGDYGSIYSWQFTTTNGGTINSISAFNEMQDFPEGSAQTQYQYAIYTDNAGYPGNYIASSALTNGSGSWDWRSLPVSATLTANTTYWLVYWANGNPVNTGDGIVWQNGIGQGCGVSYAWQNGPDNGFPDSFPTGGSCSAMSASIYATFNGSSPALTINSAGSFNENGDANFIDPTDSTTAFEIQDSANDTLFTADTADMEIIVSGTSTNFGTLVLDDSHFESEQTTSPQISTPATCGTSPTATMTDGSTDSAGSFTVTAGSGAVTGPCTVTITFQDAYGSTPKSVIVTPTTAIGTSPQGKAAIVSSTSTGSFNVEIDPTNPNSGEVNSYYYWIIE